MLRWTEEMSLPTGREDQRVRSCSRARKRDETGKPLGRRGGSGDVANIIDVLPNKDHTGGGGVTVNGGSVG
jgi:hypothetical protein